MQSDEKSISASCIRNQVIIRSATGNWENLKSFLLQAGASVSSKPSFPLLPPLWSSKSSIPQYFVFTQEELSSQTEHPPRLPGWGGNWRALFFWVSAPLTLLWHILGTPMPLYPFCMKLITLPFEKPNEVCAGHKTRCVLLKSTTHTKLQTAFSRKTAALGKGKTTRDEVAQCSSEKLLKELHTLSDFKQLNATKVPQTLSLISHMLLGSLILCSAVSRSPAALLELRQLVKQENPNSPFGTGPGCTHRHHSDTFYNPTDSLPM